VLRRRAVGLTNTRRRYLLSGFCFLGIEEGSRHDFPFADEAEMQKVWRAHRQELLAECELGIRPFAWWDLEAPKEGRHFLRGRLESPDGKLFHGRYQCINGGDPWACYEPEWAFLERHGLLTAEEKEKLPQWRRELAAELEEFDREHAEFEAALRAQGRTRPLVVPSADGVETCGEGGRRWLTTCS
jgi:hypothetical protein